MVVRIDGGEREHVENLFSGFKCKYCVKEFCGDGAIRLSCVLCMTLIVFIYMYYGLFACINLVDIMPLIFTVFSFHLLIFDKNHPGNRHTDFREKSPIYR
jgi:hypothetical protein